MNRKFPRKSDTGEANWKILTRAGFELAPSGYRCAALPVELSSPQGLEASFIQFKYTRYSRENLTLIHKRLCRVSILFQNYPQRYTWTESFHDNLTLPQSQLKKRKSHTWKYLSRTENISHLKVSISHWEYLTPRISREYHENISCS